MDDKDRYAIGQQDFKTLRRHTRQLFRIGVSFSSESRRSEYWKIES